MKFPEKNGATSAESCEKIVYKRWFPRDWMADERLARCSLGARGVWIEMLNRMMLSPETGVLLDSTSQPITHEDLAFDLRSTKKEIRRLVDELEKNRVFSKDDAGRIYSRRMVREAEVYKARAEGGKRGGEHGAKGGEHGAKGGRPRNPPHNPPSDAARGVSETPLITPLENPHGIPIPIPIPVPAPVPEASADAHTHGAEAVPVDPASPVVALARQCAATRQEYAGKTTGFYLTLRGFIGPDAVLTMDEISRVVDSFVIEHRSAGDAFSIPEASLRTRLSDAEVKKLRLKPRPRLDDQPTDESIRLSRGRRNDFHDDDDDEEGKS